VWRGLDGEAMTSCAHCRFFTLKDLPAGAIDGEGLCTGYLESLQELVAWDRPVCGIYRPAKNTAQREEWVSGRDALHGKTGLIGSPQCADGLPGSPGHPWRK
jgi:hypothetical protein